MLLFSFGQYEYYIFRIRIHNQEDSDPVNLFYFLLPYASREIIVFHDLFKLNSVFAQLFWGDKV